MKIRSKYSGVAWLAAVAAMAVGYNASAVTIDMGTVLAGGFPSGDLSSKPYLSATITDGTLSGKSGVYLSMSAPGLGFAGSGNYEHLLDWDFNVSSISGLTASSFTKTASSGHLGFTAPVISTGTTGTPVHGSFQAASSGNYFDLKFLFAEGSKGGDGPDGGVEFGNGDSITYFINGLSASSFVVATKSDGSAGTYTSAAKIDDANSGTWVAGNGAAAVPDAGSSATLLGLALLGIGGLKRKFSEV